MRRTNELVAQPQSQWHKECLYEWFVANCAYWNELTYRRPENLSVLVGRVRPSV
jgi:hypothetical protein